MAAPRFLAHCDLEGRYRSHTVEAESPMDAAIAFAEHWLPLDGITSEARVVVEDRETGAQECYVVDLAEFDAEPCPPAA